MSLLITAIVGLVSVVILILSAEYVVDKLIKIGNHYGVSSTFTGLTVMSIGTSLPEIGSHLIASLGILTGGLDYEIASATVLGANIGSDVVQQTLVLGIVIFFMGSVTFSKKFLKEAYSLMIGTTLLCIILGLDFVYSRLDGLILLSVFVAYMIYLYRHEDKHVPKRDPIKGSVGVEIALAFGGMVILLASSSFVLRSTESIVHATGLGASLIGVVTLGIASALPEMFTAIQAIRKKESGLSLGTLIGSNITNPLVAIGGGALLSTYAIPKPLILWDLPFETISAGLLLIYLLFNKRKLGRAGACYLVLLYFAYLAIRIIFFSID